MLVLSRKIEESIELSNGVKITVVRIGYKTVRIGVDAPDEVKVLRSELIERDAAK